jgi:hypothetical protein
MTTAEFHAAAAVIPWIGMGVVFNGVYLLTSIGSRHEVDKILSRSDRDRGGTSVGGNLLLVLRFGAMGAAWANMIAYAVMAAVALRLSQSTCVSGDLRNGAGSRGSRSRAAAPSPRPDSCPTPCRPG